MEENEFADLLIQYPDRRMLKRGGQKIAFKITHPKFGDVALKVGIYDSAKSQERIHREVEVLSTTSSQFFPKVYELSEHSGNRFSICEEFIEGKPLSSCMDTFYDPVLAIELLRQIVTGLQIIWARGIVHRDIKPDNLIIRPNLMPVIVDLGIARLLYREAITGDSGAPFTSGYAPLEQIRYRRGENEIRTDQFPLGIILFQQLTKGSHPFDPQLIEGDSILDNIINGRWNRAALEVAELKRFRHLITRLLGQHPHLRFRNQEELVAEILFAQRG